MVGWFFQGFFSEQVSKDTRVKGLPLLPPTVASFTYSSKEAKALYLLGDVFVLKCQPKHRRHYALRLLYPGEQTTAAQDTQILSLMEHCHLKEPKIRRLFHFL